MTWNMEITLSGPVELSDIKEVAYIYKEIAFSGRLTLYIEHQYYMLLIEDPEVKKSLIFTWDLNRDLRLYGALISSYDPEFNAEIWRSSKN